MLIDRIRYLQPFAKFSLWAFVAIFNRSGTAVAQSALPVPQTSRTTSVDTKAGTSDAKDQIWVGEITTAMCKGTKSSMGHDCILNCVKAGEHLVLMTRGGKHELSNQDFAGLTEHAGHRVRLTGYLAPGSSTITITGLK